MSWLYRLYTLCVYYLLLGLMWVGAEYVFEGSVHTSAVDAVVCMVLACKLLGGDSK